MLQVFQFLSKSEMKKIRAIIIDDEPFARKGIKRELERDGTVEITAECANGSDAISAIKEQKPDLVFLDLQMPEIDGFGVVESIGVEKMPFVIFVTAFDQFALKAFEIHALDYILKPFDSERFQKTLQRAKKLIQQENINDLHSRLSGLLDEAKKNKGEFLERIVVKNAGKIFFLSVEEIDWIEASDNYVRLHVGKESHLVHGTMNKLESKLNPEKFLRVHRSTIVNLSRIKELHPLFHGEYAILLQNGKEITSSRTYKNRLQKFLQNSF